MFSHVYGKLFVSYLLGCCCCCFFFHRLLCRAIYAPLVDWMNFSKEQYTNTTNVQCRLAVSFRICMMILLRISKVIVCQKFWQRWPAGPATLTICPTYSTYTYNAFIMCEKKKVFLGNKNFNILQYSFDSIFVVLVLLFNYAPWQMCFTLFWCPTHADENDWHFFPTSHENINSMRFNVCFKFVLLGRDHNNVHAFTTIQTHTENVDDWCFGYWLNRDHNTFSRIRWCKCKCNATYFQLLIVRFTSVCMMLCGYRLYDIR